MPGDTGTEQGKKEKKQVSSQDLDLFPLLQAMVG